MTRTASSVALMPSSPVAACSDRARRRRERSRAGRGGRRKAGAEPSTGTCRCETAHPFGPSSTSPPPRRETLQMPCAERQRIESSASPPPSHAGRAPLCARRRRAETLWQLRAPAPELHEIVRLGEGDRRRASAPTRRDASCGANRAGRPARQANLPEPARRPLQPQRRQRQPHSDQRQPSPEAGPLSDLG